MDIIKTSTDWARAEMLSSSFFILFGVGFLLASYGFSHLGKTDLAKAYVIPLIVTGGLLLAIGLGIFGQSFFRLSSFVSDYNADASAFIASEIARAERVLNDYSIAVFRVIPLIVVVCAVLLMIFNTPIWRASLVSVIAMMAVIFLIDTNASARLEVYKERLSAVEKG